MVGLYLGIGILALFSRDIGTVIMATTALPAPPPTEEENKFKLKFIRVDLDHREREGVNIEILCI